MAGYQEVLDAITQAVSDVVEGRTDVDVAVPLASSGLDSIAMLEVVSLVQLAGHDTSGLMQKDAFSWAELSLRDLADLISSDSQGSSR